MAHRTRSILPLGRKGNKVVIDYTIPPYARAPTLTREQMERNLAILRSIDAAHNVGDDTIPQSVSPLRALSERQALPEKNLDAAQSETGRARSQPAICGVHQVSPSARDSVWAPFAFGESPGAEERIAAEPRTDSDSEKPNGDPSGSDSEHSEEHAVAPETPKTPSPLRLVDITAQTDDSDEKRIKVENSPEDVKLERPATTVDDNAEQQGPLGCRFDIVTRPDAAMRAQFAKLLLAKADELRDQMNIVVIEGEQVLESEKLEHTKAANDKKVHEEVEKTLLKVESLLDEAILEKKETEEENKTEEKDETKNEENVETKKEANVETM